MRVRTWYLVRHGETDWNAERRMQGDFESSLNDKGRAQARRSGETLALLGVDCLYASPLLRVRQTLFEIAPILPVAAIFDDRLKEWSAGDWSGYLYGDIAKDWPELFAAWEKDIYNVRAPGGENFLDLDARAASFLSEAETSSCPRFAIAAHGFINRALAGRLLSLRPEEIIDIRQGNDTIFRIKTGDGPAIAEHFVGGEGPIPGLPRMSMVQSSIA